jgi:hypothetical protein
MTEYPLMLGLIPIKEVEMELENQERICQEVGLFV